MAVLALRGNWSLTLANVAKEADIAKKGSTSKPAQSTKVSQRNHGPGVPPPARRSEREKR
jgi:hypothetical protein